MKSIFIPLLLFVLIVIGFTTTHHALYGNCHQTSDGQSCQLIKWVGNK
jgi:hypothetical protein